MAQSTYIARKGEDADFAALSADSLTLAGASVSTAVLLASGQAIDLNGETGGIIWDADQNTKWYPSADNVVTLNHNGASDFTFAANLFTALSGSSIATNTITETTAASGVTIDSLLVKDGGATLAGDGRIDFSSVTVAAANTDGGIIKGGTSAARLVEDTADMRFINFNFDNGATSGDNRGMYLRLYLTGAGGGGEAARIFTTVEDVAGGTAHGAHISLNFGATGSITGLGVAARGTLQLPDAAMSGGTYASMQPEIWSDGSSTNPSSVTELSFIRISNGGDSTGVAAVDDKAYLLSIQGGAISAGNMVAVKTSAAVSHTIRVLVGSTVMYLMASTTQ